MKWVDRMIANAVWREVTKKMPFLAAWLKRIIPQNLAGFIGIAQELIQLVREILVAGVRIAAIVVPGKLPAQTVDTIGNFFNALDEGIEKAKNILL